MQRLPKIWIAVLAASAGCSRPDGGAFQPAREIRGEDAKIHWGLDSRVRLRLAPFEADSHQEHATDDGPPLRLAYELPSGWSERPTNDMRVANFRVAGNEEAECYLTLLGSDGGGLTANVNRWRRQLSLPDLGEEEILALPRAELFRGQATLLDAVGTWTGMSGTESKKDWRLTGLLLVNAQASAFLKMTGPDAAIASEKEHFLALARSIRFEPREAGENPASTTAGDQPHANPSMGHAEGLDWTAPSSWKTAAPSPMRAANFKPREGVECYLAVLDGEGGGALANANRWRKQLGNADLTPAEFDALPSLQVLGANAHLIEIDGRGEHAGKKMLGVLAIAGGRSVFVKMTGPAASVEQERENFRAFAESLREKS